MFGPQMLPVGSWTSSLLSVPGTLRMSITGGQQDSGGSPPLNSVLGCFLRGALWAMSCLCHHECEAVTLSRPPDIQAAAWHSTLLTVPGRCQGEVAALITHARALAWPCILDSFLILGGFWHIEVRLELSTLAHSQRNTVGHDRKAQ